MATTIAPVELPELTTDDLARYSRQMPLKEYHDMITLAYEEIVR